jgi:hypothetical protein
MYMNSLCVLPIRCLPPVPILSQLDPVRTPKSYFLKIHLHIIRHILLGLANDFLPSSFPTKILYTPLLLTYMHACFRTIAKH